jgi:polysaccharide biosynthesis protein PslH
VVATPQACGALDVVPGQDVLVTGESQQFGRQIVSVLGYPELAARLRQAGRRYVETHHDWNVVAERLEGIYQEVVESRAEWSAKRFGQRPAARTNFDGRSGRE